MNKYCMVLTLKAEHMEEYVALHKNPWPEILFAIKKAGAEELVIFKWENNSIVFFECEDLDKFYENYGKISVVQKWNQHTAPWFDTSPHLSANKENLEKIFDYKEQLSELLKESECGCGYKAPN